MRINEVIVNTTPKKGISHVIKDVAAVIKNPKFYKLQQIGKLPSGHMVWTSADPEGTSQFLKTPDPKSHLYFTTSPNQPTQPEMIVSTFNKTGWKGEWINYLTKTNAATHDAVSLYVFLLDQGKTLIAWSQSPGALAVWRKLARRKNVSIHGWDEGQDKAVNIDPLLRDEEETHEPDDKWPGFDYLETHGRSIKDLLLVASKR
jgi:hypothetical protein